jgi:hypothetical protein
MRDGGWGGPGVFGQDRNGFVSLGGADQEGQAAGWGDERCGSGQDLIEALDCAESDNVKRVGDGFGTRVLYIDVRQCKGARDFAKECDFLVVGFDQGERDLRRPEFYRETGESGAGTYIGNGFHHRGHWGHRGRAREQIAGGQEAFAEVAGDDFFGVADGGEVDAGVPAEEYIDVRRYMLKLGGGQDSGFLSTPLGARLSSVPHFGVRWFGLLRFGMTGADERGQQLGDAGGVHGQGLIVDGAELGAKA